MKSKSRSLEMLAALASLGVFPHQEEKSKPHEFGEAWIKHQADKKAHKALKRQRRLEKLLKAQENK